MTITTVPTLTDRLLQRLSAELERRRCQIDGDAGIARVEFAMRIDGQGQRVRNVEFRLASQSDKG